MKTKAVLHHHHHDVVRLAPACPARAALAASGLLIHTSPLKEQNKEIMKSSLVPPALKFAGQKGVVGNP